MTIAPRHRQLPHAKSNRVRIIGGEHRSRVLHFPAIESLRPTPDRVRETLFNWLGQTLQGKTCLDLFAGSGALGFEALSRGAQRAVLVERDPAVAKALTENAKLLRLQNVEIVAADALQYLAATQNKFDIVFLDPPFRSELLPKALGHVPRILLSEGLVYAESEPGFAAGEAWRVLRSSRAGNVQYQLMDPAR
jgi:16S rRNA (guanine966-N2)-methyltransferase